MWAALARGRLRGLGARGCPTGLDTQVGSGNQALTPAQAQQVALARLIIADPHTLVLDEATSLIDPRTARTLEGSMNALLEGRTVVAIAHRLHTAHDADRIAVVIDGRIVELGTHDELVAAGRRVRRALAGLDLSRARLRTVAGGRSGPRRRDAGRPRRPGGRRGARARRRRRRSTSTARSPRLTTSSGPAGAVHVDPRVVDRLLEPQAAADEPGQRLDDRGRDPVAPGEPIASTEPSSWRPTVGAMLDSSRAPGARPCSPAGLSSCSPRQLLSQIPVPAAIIPEQ